MSKLKKKNYKRMLYMWDMVVTTTAAGNVVVCALLDLFVFANASFFFSSVWCDSSVVCSLWYGSKSHCMILDNGSCGRYKNINFMAIYKTACLCNGMLSAHKISQAKHKNTQWLCNVFVFLSRNTVARIFFSRYFD